MLKRKLGTQGLEVGAIGLGCMGLTWAYGPVNEAESLKVLHRAVELGINFWDTAELYGPFTNEQLIGKALKTIPRDKVIIATKFAFRFNDKGERAELDSSPTHIRKSIEGSLQRLGTDYIDLYYQHRLDPKTPIEDTVGALKDLIHEGKVRYIGLSEVGPGTIRKAHSVHPITAVQSEYSLWERRIEDKVLPTLRELGIGLVPFSPLGRGFLSGRFTKREDLDPTDFRLNHPRFQEDNIQHNIQLVKIINEIANTNDITPAQVALAWLLKQGHDIVPIPGTKHVKYLNENAHSVTVKLLDTAWEPLTKMLKSFTTFGERYVPADLKYIDHTE